MHAGITARLGGRGREIDWKHLLPFVHCNPSLCTCYPYFYDCCTAPIFIVYLISINVRFNFGGGERATLKGLRTLAN